MALPLLHKYVLSPEDDKDLTLAKLRYRLCVKEVCEVLISRAQEKGFDPSQTTSTDDDSFHRNPILKWEDSGIGTDESVLDDLQSPQHYDSFRITDEEPSINDISRQPGSVSDETFPPEASPFLSSPSTSSDSCGESEETEKPYLNSRNGENFDNGENVRDREYAENVYTEAKDNVAPVHISSCPGIQVENLHDEDEEMEETSFAPVMSSTLDQSRLDQSTDNKSPLDENPPESTLQSQGNDINSSTKRKKERCNDVDEALRILMTRKELPQIIARKPVASWSTWIAADIARGQQRVQTEVVGEQESQAKRNSSRQLQAMHEKILNKDRKLADTYRKIKERDDEDQRIVKELLKKQTIPYAEPLPVALPPKPAPEPVETPKPRVEKDVVVSDAKPTADSSARKTLTRTEEPPAGKKKKQGNVFQNVVHSLQRRFSKRGRGDTTAAS